MKSLLLAFLLVFGLVSLLSAQEVEHNYIVGPQNTDCDSLDFSGLTTDEAIGAIMKAKFRLDQQFKLNRPEGLRAGAFYSCDNKNGFLIILFGRKKYLFTDVPLSTWDTFVTSAAPEDFYLQRIQPVFNEYQKQPE